MKVHALKNPYGDIIATFEKGLDGSLHMEPEVPQGHKIEVVEVPDDYKSDLNAFYKMKKSSQTTFSGIKDLQLKRRYTYLDEYIRGSVADYLELANDESIIKDYYVATVKKPSYGEAHFAVTNKRLIMASFSYFTPLFPRILFQE